MTRVKGVRAGRESTETLVHLYRQHIGWCRVHFVNPTSTGIKYAAGCADAFAYKYFDERRYRFRATRIFTSRARDTFFPRYFSDFSEKFDIHRTLRIRLRAFFLQFPHATYELPEAKFIFIIQQNLCDLLILFSLCQLC